MVNINKDRRGRKATLQTVKAHHKSEENVALLKSNDTRLFKKNSITQKNSEMR